MQKIPSAISSRQKMWDPCNDGYLKHFMKCEEYKIQNYQAH